ncbi:Uncharacterised protein at_DN1428 [Pycnogonum litorale]
MKSFLPIVILLSTFGFDSIRGNIVSQRIKTCKSNSVVNILSVSLQDCRRSSGLCSIRSGRPATIKLVFRPKTDLLVSCFRQARKVEGAVAFIGFGFLDLPSSPQENRICGNLFHEGRPVPVFEDNVRLIRGKTYHYSDSIKMARAFPTDVEYIVKYHLKTAPKEICFKVNLEIDG